MDACIINDVVIVIKGWILTDCYISHNGVTVSAHSCRILRQHSKLIRITRRGIRRVREGNETAADRSHQRDVFRRVDVAPVYHGYGVEYVHPRGRIRRRPCNVKE